MALNCLPCSPAECKGHYPVGTLALGSSGAAGCTHKWNFKQKTHKVTSSDENLDSWTVGKLRKSQMQTDYINSFGKPKQACLKEANIPSHRTCLGSEHRATEFLLPTHTHVSYLHCPAKHLSIFSFHMTMPVWEISYVCMSTWKETNSTLETGVQKMINKPEVPFLPTNRHPWSGSSKSLITTERNDDISQLFPHSPPNHLLVPLHLTYTSVTREHAEAANQLIG